jgi:hypothetical protein
VIPVARILTALRVSRGSFRHLAGAALLSAAVATPQSLHLEVSDPTGDSVAPRNAPTLNGAPDLIAAVADVAAGNLTINIRFAPATFDPRKMGVFVYLDTDDNPLTPAGGSGYEYFVGSNTGGIMKYNSGDRTTVLAKVAYSPDQVRLTIPLKSIGNRDGHLAFRVAAYTRAAPSAGAIQAFVDEMPDSNLPAVRLR